MTSLGKLFILQILFIPLLAFASRADIEEVLSSNEVPAGVVIEIITGDEQGLDWALPQARHYIDRLRQRFPSVPIAIVTHGREQFALQKDKRASNKKVHSLTESLLKQDVQLHVCGTFAGWEGLAKEDFPDYVDVAPAGPAQVNDYLALDYKLIVIKQRGPD